MSGKDTDDEYLIIAATRYTLGRQSYAVVIMTDILKARAAKLSEITREVIARDIREQEKYGYGDLDRKAWMEALAAVEREAITPVNNPATGIPGRKGKHRDCR